MSKEGWSYAALDESRNGRFPTIYASVLSSSSSDMVEYPQVQFPKLRRNHKKLSGKLSNKDYSFLLLTQTENDLIGSWYKVRGIIMASLIQDEPLDNPFHFFIDGEMPKKELDYLGRMLQETTGLEKDLFIHYGKDLDRRVWLVNVADEIAHWLAQKPSESLRKNLHQKSIPKEFLINL
jgi:hypothetical protein